MAVLVSTLYPEYLEGSQPYEDAQSWAWGVFFMQKVSVPSPSASQVDELLKRVVANGDILDRFMM